MSSKIEHVTMTIAGTTASGESALLSGYLAHVKIEVRTAAGAASSDTCTVTITDSVTGRTLLTATGITGVANHYPLLVNAKGADGAAVAGVYTRIYLASQRMNIAVTSGTATNVVTVFGVIAPQ